MLQPLNAIQQILRTAPGQYARSCIESALKQGVVRGLLVIEDRTGQTREYGQVGEENQRTVKLVVKDDAFWTRVYLSHGLGFSEAFMAGDVDVSSLKDVLNLYLDNEDTLQGLWTTMSMLREAASVAMVRLFGQSLSNAKLNVITGYDTSNAFFQSFLSPDMTYSSALWPESAGGIRGDLTPRGSLESDLEAAQRHKVAHLLSKARLRPGDRLLEFGSGWGALAIAAGKMGCEVDTITLSVNQKALAEERIEKEGLTGRVRVHLCDYRNLPAEFEHAFDGFVSVEMVEAVGYKYLPQYFQILDWALKPDRAAAIITATTQPENRYTVHQANDYARRYQWPNSFCPSATSFISTCAEATQGRFALESAEDFGIHYPRTLREWGYRLEKNWNEQTIAALVKDQPKLDNPEALAAFKRKWEYMYVYAEVGYARAYTSMHYFTFVRPGFVAAACD
ncbi:CFS1-like protein [Peniophora sp. CONT]|nr:CFS1-like protein [Peniophora sp. CONT]